jgi:hypothetical protein
MRQIRTTIGAATINPALLTAAEKLQYDGYLRREETNAVILAMAKEGARSSRSCEAPATAAALFERCFAVRGWTSSAFGAVRSKPTFPGLTNNGRRAVATAQSYGAP